MRAPHLAVAILLSLTPSLAHAQEPAGDTLCTDRPGRASGSCTVPRNAFQYEADIGSGSYQRLHGVTVDSGVVVNPELKYGLTPSSDVEVQWSPLAFQRTHVSGGKDALAAGPGDLFLRFKQNIYGGNDGAVSVAVVPYLKAPTASHLLGNGAFDGGVYIPVNFKIGDAWSVALTPEVDVIRDAAGGGHHVQHSEVVGVGRSLPGDWVLLADIYAQWDFERHGATQSTLDFAATKTLHKTLQLDAGVYIGLNRATPGATTYLGVSQRF